MRLYSFRIQNFKSIEDTGIIKVSKDDNVTIFAGQNEAGKSAILEALNFLERGVDVDFEETFRRVETNPRVECTYLLNDEELDEIEETGSKSLRDYIAKNGLTFIRGKIEEDDFGSLKYWKPVGLSSLMEEIDTLHKNADPEAEIEKFNFDKLFKIRPKFIFYPIKYLSRS